MAVRCGAVARLLVGSNAHIANTHHLIVDPFINEIILFSFLFAIIR